MPFNWTTSTTRAAPEEPEGAAGGGAGTAPNAAVPDPSADAAKATGAASSSAARRRAPARTTRRRTEAFMPCCSTLLEGVLYLDQRARHGQAGYRDRERLLGVLGLEGRRPRVEARHAGNQRAAVGHRRVHPIDLEVDGPRHHERLEVARALERLGRPLLDAPPGFDRLVRARRDPPDRFLDRDGLDVRDELLDLLHGGAVAGDEGDGDFEVAGQRGVETRLPDDQVAELDLPDARAAVGVVENRILRAGGGVVAGEEDGVERGVDR